LRHPDAALYYRQYHDSYLIGSYRHTALRTGDGAALSAPHTSTPDDWERSRRATAELLHQLADKDFIQQVNDYLLFSNDLNPIVGQSTLRGLWAAFSVWAAYAGGVGKSIAELMTHGETEWDIRAANINRFHPHDYTRAFMAAHIDCQHQEIHAVVHPLQQMEAPRNVRLAPFHQRLVEQRAVFFANAGWEVPQWYEANAALLEEYDARVPHREGWARAFLVAYPGCGTPGNARPRRPLQSEHLHQD
jgi:hypothetical protein